MGALGALQSATVEFVVHNKFDFDNIFLPYFMKPGSIVGVDYGWIKDSSYLYEPLEKFNNNVNERSNKLTGGKYSIEILDDYIFP